MFRILVCLIPFCLFADPIIRSNARIHPESSTKAMVVSQDSIATDIALKVLKEGGNAADAAIALAYAQAVTQPKAGNIGGGGFALYFDNKTKKTYAIDFREVAPLKTHKDTFLDKDGNVDKNKKRFSLAATAVPGTVAGMEFIRKSFGSLTNKKLISPAIDLAAKGFPVSAGLAYDLTKVKKIFEKDNYLKGVFLPSGKPLTQGENLIQKDLAKTLSRLAEHGPQDFYKGQIADRFTSYFKSQGGFISKQDLANYKAYKTEPVKGTYRGHDVLSMPPPSSGGVHLIQMLNVLEQWDLRSTGHNSASYIHLLAETMKLAYADRSKHLGDPAFANIPSQGIISKEYANKLRSKINLQKATPADKIAPGSPQVFESPDTTHFSIVDQFGNAISVTYTINFSFGNRKMIPGLGFFLNNEMDDFSGKNGIPNGYGLIGSEANSVEAGKRPLSSMTPVIVMKDNKPFIITGSPGGSRIITTVLQVILNVIDHDMNIAEASLAPRVHHQWLPDVLNIESGLSPDTIQLLHLLGHKTLKNGTAGCAESILIDKGIIYGYADPRRIDGKAAGLD
ncbi:MAG: gamma-glutamyltransferase [Lentisphaeraceae bacterium]|nr:gamma-glutamyltransferase [Lentisphaeraceae bacterium]